MKCIVYTLACIFIIYVSGAGQTENGSRPSSIKDLWKLSDSLTQLQSKPSAASKASTYLYIEDFEVRHEILMPFFVVNKWTELKYKDPLSIDTLEQKTFHEPIGTMTGDICQVTIDGIPVKPIVSRIDYIAPEYIDSIQVTRSGPIDAYTSWVGVILTYETKGTPGTVEVNWDKFDSYLNEASSIIYAFEEKDLYIYSQGNNNYRWKNPGRPPIPPIDEIKREQKPWWQFWGDDLSDSKAGAIFESLLKNVYRAFDYKSESDVYDALANSVEGELLAEIYLQIRKSLEMQEQGGAVSKIKEVIILNGNKHILDNKYSDSDHGFGYAADWTVKGTVEHWGHIHARTNRYTARFQVIAINDSWKIVDLMVLKQERIKFESILRE